MKRENSVCRFGKLTWDRETNLEARWRVEKNGEIFRRRERRGQEKPSVSSDGVDRNLKEAGHMQR